MPGKAATVLGGGIGRGDFHAEPRPRVRLRPPGRWYHLGKVLYGKYRLTRGF